jgi:hypothetical protein
VRTDEQGTWNDEGGENAQGPTINAQCSIVLTEVFEKQKMNSANE